MCLSVPSRIVAIEGDFATVEAFGVTRICSLMLLGEAVAIGDYLVLGPGGGFATERLSEDDALAALDILGEMLEAGRA